MGSLLLNCACAFRMFCICFSKKSFNVVIHGVVGSKYLHSVFSRAKKRTAIRTTKADSLKLHSHNRTLLWYTELEGLCAASYHSRLDWVMQLLFGRDVYLYQICVHGFYEFRWEFHRILVCFDSAVTANSLSTYGDKELRQKCHLSISCGRVPCVLFCVGRCESIKTIVVCVCSGHHAQTSQSRFTACDLVSIRIRCRLCFGQKCSADRK